VRPEVLYPLFADISTLPGVGPRTRPLFEKLAGPHVVDLCWHLPTGIIDRSYTPKVADAQPSRVATLTVQVGEHHAPSSRRAPYKVRCFDDTGVLDLVFFHAKPDYLTRILPVGEARVVSGKVEIFHGLPQISHPDHVLAPEQAEEAAGVEPTHALTTGLTQKVVAKAIAAALSRAPDLPEWLDPEFRARKDWPAWRGALSAAHHPAGEDDLSPLSLARQRLAYDELLSNQLALALVRRHHTHAKGREIHGDGHLRARAVAALPFDLTGSQSRATREILADMAAPHRMLRLLQGDVGSGKTVVALLAMLTAVEAGAQAALMAPTEVLARQHYATIQPLAAAAGVNALLLTGRDKGKARRAVLEELASGRAMLAVGTHALFQEDVTFHDLGLAVIDEQHRFGVHQRMTLQSKGQGVDVLVMTATPIPRTLVLTSYGDMESSRLTEKPAGRQPVDTRVISLDRMEQVVGGIERTIAQGHKAFWVCPLVEESDGSDLAAAEARYAALKERFGGRVGLVHGRMKGADKDRVMAAFRDGDVDLLVATTVIEVGVDVPAATAMVIEHAERFGLAQLHQLRGRIGRGTEKATCLLLYQGPLGETARARLRTMRETEDGFRIAEEDLRLRGHGELLGTRQSGFPEFLLADLAVHGDLLAAARDDVKLQLDRDPELRSARGAALRVLLYLFERDAAVKFLRAG
jgi:ATP-dependent DNA helicase RecG